MAGTWGREVISTRQRKIAELARREPKLTLTTLAHHVDEVWMREAYRRTRKDAAAGVDGVTAAQYEADLEANLSGLLERFKSGRYRAPAVRRVHLEKPGTSKTRPIGIPTLEDKILQRAVLMVMEPVYEQEFLECSYGFRPGRGAHQALDALWQGLMEFGGGWVIDLDIEDFFGSVDWGHLRSFLDRRVRDGVIRRAIGKWLNAGVMEAGELSYPQRGTPQGGVVSPTLSNVYLHEVLDQWFEREVKPRLRGRAFEVRYADDVAMVFEHEDDARRVLGGVGETAGEVRPAPAPGEDADGGLSQSEEVTAGRFAARAQLRDAGVHALLGTLQEGAMDSQTQDGQGPTQPSAEGDWPLVPESSALETARPAGGAEPQAARSLRVLRHHRQLPGAEPIPIRSGTAVAQMARSEKLAGTHDMGPLCAPTQHLSSPRGASRAQCVPLSSETIVRRAVCLNWARTDPREPRVGNRPRPPG